MAGSDSDAQRLTALIIIRNARIYGARYFSAGASSISPVCKTKYRASSSDHLSISAAAFSSGESESASFPAKPLNVRRNLWSRSIILSSIAEFDWLHDDQDITSLFDFQSGSG